MQTSKGDHIGFWRIVARGLREGRPLTKCLDQARSELAGTAWEAVCESAIRALGEGATLSRALQEHTELLDPRIIAAVTAGEEAGVLDVKASEIAEALEADDLDSLAGSGSPATLDAEAAEIADYVASVVRAAIEQRASDVHFEPCEGGGGRVRFRVDGVLYEVETIPGERHAKVAGRLKIMAGMDVAERRLPQDGRILLEISGSRYDLRVSTIPVIWGERIVCRVLARQNIPLGLENVGLSAEDMAKVEHLGGLPNGIVIVNGPTGCGKTTVLYSILLKIDRQSHCVLTVEDPVEVTFDGLSQMQIRPAIGMTFARAIRSMLRQDPDVIMVGELRDLEMMNLCVQVALTGHLLFTTLHATTSVGAIRRLIDCGVEPFLINSALAGVITPRLVRVLCTECRRPADPPADHLIPREAAKIIAGLPGATFYEPVGCDACAGTGYHGRTGIFEILTMDDRIRQTVATPVDMAAMFNAARASGMKTMLADGLEKAARGVTSVREVVRVVPQETHR